MNQRARFILIATLVVVLLAVIGYLNLEWVEFEVDAGIGDEARRNDFLAAELFLQEAGVSTETVTGMSLLDGLPIIEDAILLSASRESLSVRRRDALVSWVSRGGLLFAVAHSVVDQEEEVSGDPLLDSLGVFLIEAESESYEEELGDLDKMADERASTSSEEGSDDGQGDDLAEAIDLEELPETLADLLERQLPDKECLTSPEEWTEVSMHSGERLILELASSRELGVKEEDLSEAFFSDTAQVLSLKVGSGRVIAFTSIEFLQNNRIHCHDHAYFIWNMIRNRRKLWLLHDPDVPSLSRLALASLPASSAGGLALLILLMSSASLRFGISSVEEESQRRENRERLQAGVTFQFRKGGFAELFGLLREDLHQRIARSGDGWKDELGIPNQDVEEALAESIPEGRREILKRVQTMLHMRRKL